MATDKRITAVEDEKKEALTENESTYGGMISSSDKYYQDQINASKNWAEEQKKQQQDRTDFTIEQINQQKDQTRSDYIKQQSGAYVDWQKQSNKYGANAEKMAANGLWNSGYSESAQVNMYNTYQNRVTAALESYNRAVLNYDNAIKDAQLQNSSILAEIAYQALQQQLELSLQGFQYKNSLILEKAKTEREIKSEYYNRYLAVLDQINTEKALAEEKRQFNEQIALQREQFEWQQEQANKTSGVKVTKNTSGKSNGSTKSSRSTEPSQKITVNGKETYFVDGLGALSKEDFERLWDKNMIIETIKDGEVYYKTAIPKSALVKIGLWRIDK